MKPSRHLKNAIMKIALAIFFLPAAWPPFGPSTVLACEGDQARQAQLGGLVLGEAYKGVSFGYLCQYPQSTLNEDPKLPYYHAGVDFVASPGTVVRAALPGSVTPCSTKTCTPDSTMLVPDGQVNGLSIRIFYLHIIPTKTGRVAAGDPIATVKDMSGPHLHVEARKSYTSTYAVGRTSSPDKLCDTKEEVAALTVDPGVIMSGGAAASPGRVPDTGQTKCYDNVWNEISPCPKPGERFYGQDANYTINPMSFTKLGGGGMVRDNVTGLIWEVKRNMDGEPDYGDPRDADNTYTWYDPNPDTNGGYEGVESDHDTKDFIDALNNAKFGGYSDWRMPTRKELRTIVDYSIPYPGLTINTIYFPNTVEGGYWSSTANADYTDSAWGRYFYGGDDIIRNKGYDYYVRAVRGGQ